MTTRHPRVAIELRLLAREIDDLLDDTERQLSDAFEYLASLRKAARIESKLHAAGIVFGIAFGTRLLEMTPLPAFTIHLVCIVEAHFGNRKAVGRQ